MGADTHIACRWAITSASVSGAPRLAMMGAAVVRRGAGTGFCETTHVAGARLGVRTTNADAGFVVGCAVKSGSLRV